MYLLGYDIGSSSVKVALVNTDTGQVAGIAQYPPTEMEILAPQPDWAEQHPERWWECACAATRQLLDNTGVSPEHIGGIGIAYQMHGLVCVDKGGAVLRPSIIWCDSRAVSIGQQAFEAIGTDYCLAHYLNGPGNFTASKLRWVKMHEPALFKRIHKIMLPGDYIAYRMTGDICTTITGLSEGIFWDFKNNGLAQKLLDHYEIPAALIPDIVPAFANQGQLNEKAALELGLKPGITVGYRAGDQPNNALSLNALRPGDVAATGGTSGVVYAVTDQPRFDPETRVNSFAHVNYSAQHPLTGVLLCINGSGIQYNWMRQYIGGGDTLTYNDMEKMASNIPIGSEGLQVLPFGNGAERMLQNRNIGARILQLQFNRHTKPHFYRAALEGIAFSFVYGMDILRDMDIDLRQLRVGGDNLFRSAIFSKTIATLTNCNIEVIDTTGAVGAAHAAGVAVGAYRSVEEALQNGHITATHEPDSDDAPYQDAYQNWKLALDQALATTN